MYKFLEKLKAEAEANPILALGVSAGFITAVAKLIDAASGIKSRNAYAADRKRAKKG